MENVLVTVIGTQCGIDGEESRIELIAKGHRKQQAGITYITYKEALSGLDDTTTLLKLYADSGCLVRMGSYEQKQEFRPGEKTYSPYITPYGNMELGVLTRNLSIDRAQTDSADAEQTVLLCYELEINGQWQSTNTLQIKVTKDSP